jgi:pantothenate kinase
VSIFYQFKIQEGMINLKQNGRSKKHLQIGQDFSDYVDSGGLEIIDRWLVQRFTAFSQDKDASSKIICRAAMPMR